MILSTEYENKILDLFRGQPIEAIPNFYVGLIKTDGSEVSAASYARINIPSSLITWLSTQGDDNVSSGTSGEISNVVPMSWGTALETWGIVNRVRFFTSPSGSSYFCDHTVTETVITNGTTVQILAGDFVITTRND